MATTRYSCPLCGAITESRYCSVHRRDRQRQKRGSWGDNTGAWKRLSAAAIKRDGELCQLRLAGCTIKATTADHIVPKDLGGRDSLDNLQAACRPCNTKRGAQQQRGTRRNHIVSQAAREDRQKLALYLG